MLLDLKREWRGAGHKETVETVGGVYPEVGVVIPRPTKDPRRRTGAIERGLDQIKYRIGIAKPRAVTPR